MRNIPGSIYLPRKHFPTKQKYQQETAEGDNPEDRLKHTTTKEQLIVYEKRRNVHFPSRNICLTVEPFFMFRGRKGTLHAGVVKKKGANEPEAVQITVTGFRQEEAREWNYCTTSLRG